VISLAFSVAGGWLEEAVAFSLQCPADPQGDGVAVESLAARGHTEELPAVRARLAIARAKTDLPISTSCLCRTSVKPHSAVATDCHGV
jgi:hypothetical protein